jgi:quercetin dioxygenase-like cupin family protein
MTEHTPLTVEADCDVSGRTEIKEGQSFTVFAGTKHYFQALEDTVAIEIMFVKYDANDIDRENIGSVQDVGEESK